MNVNDNRIKAPIAHGRGVGGEALYHQRRSLNLNKGVFDVFVLFDVFANQYICDICAICVNS